MGVEWEWGSADEIKGKGENTIKEESHALPTHLLYLLLDLVFYCVMGFPSIGRGISTIFFLTFIYSLAGKNRRLARSPAYNNTRI